MIPKITILVFSVALLGHKKIEFEGVGPIWRDPRRNSASNPASDVQNDWMATRLVPKRCDLGSLGVPAPVSTPLASQGLEVPGPRGPGDSKNGGILEVPGPRGPGGSKNGEKMEVPGPMGLLGSYGQPGGLFAPPGLSFQGRYSPSMVQNC